MFTELLTREEDSEFIALTANKASSRSRRQARDLPHIFVASFKHMAGLDMIHVPLRGGSRDERPHPRPG